MPLPFVDPAATAFFLPFKAICRNDLRWGLDVWYTNESIITIASLVFFKKGVTFFGGGFYEGQAG
jgi:hypothetical protein